MTLKSPVNFPTLIPDTKLRFCWSNALEKNDRTEHIFYQGASAIVLCIEHHTNNPTLNEWLSKTIALIRRYTTEKLPIFLALTKTDLSNTEALPDALYETLKRQYHLAGYYRYSAKTGVGVEDLFNAVAGAVQPQRRIQPIFPSPLMAQIDPERVYSDHALIKMTFSTTAPFTLLSLNTLGANASCSGFHTAAGWETESETTERYGRILTSLKTAVETHQAVVIFLQEATADWVEPSLSLLGDRWKMVSTPGLGVITLFDTLRFSLLTETPDLKNRIQTLVLTDLQTAQPITLHNVWGQYAPTPVAAEALFKEKLQDFSHSELVILAGDTNSRIAPLGAVESDSPRNIATGVIPLMFNPDDSRHTQCPDFPDGGFFALKSSGLITQWPHEILDFATALPLSGTAELGIQPEYHMTLCIDSYFETAPLLAGKTLFAYETYLREKLGDPTILVRRASNHLNEKAIGVMLGTNDASQRLEAHLKTVLETTGSVFTAIDHDGRSHTCVFVPATQLPKLTQAIREHCDPTVADRFATLFQRSKPPQKAAIPEPTT